MRYLITGKNGEVGSVITKRVKNLRQEIFNEIEDLHYEKNIRIIHTAAKHRADAISKLINSNVNYMFEVIEFAKKLKNTDLIFCSSVSIYSEESLGVISEDSNIYSNDFYSLTKLLGEQMLLKEEINSVILRLPAILELKNNNNLMSRLLRLLMKNEKIDIINGSKLFNGFVDIDDIARFCTEWPYEKNRKEIYNFAAPPKMTLMSIINFLKDMTKSKSVIKSINKKTESKIFSIDKISKAGFKFSRPEDSLEKWVIEKMKNS